MPRRSIAEIVANRKRMAIFWSHVNKTDTCWLWTGTKHKTGYGLFDHSVQLAHRISWTCLRGTIHGGLYVLHHCDVPLCVNPDHLFLGDSRANLIDAANKGRTLKGERNPQAKLSVPEVEEIRYRVRMGEAQASVARSIGMSTAAVYRVASGQGWKNVPP